MEEIERMDKQRTELAESKKQIFLFQLEEIEKRLKHYASSFPDWISIGLNRIENMRKELSGDNKPKQEIDMDYFDDEDQKFEEDDEDVSLEEDEEQQSDEQDQEE